MLIEVDCRIGRPRKVLRQRVHELPLAITFELAHLQRRATFDRDILKLILSEQIKELGIRCPPVSN